MRQMKWMAIGLLALMTAQAQSAAASAVSASPATMRAAPPPIESFIEGPGVIETMPDTSRSYEAPVNAPDASGSFQPQPMLQSHEPEASSLYSDAPSLRDAPVVTTHEEPSEFYNRGGDSEFFNRGGTTEFHDHNETSDFIHTNTESSQ